MTLSELNVLPLKDARAALLECCGSRAWAEKLIQLRPFPSERELFEKAAKTWEESDASAWLEAFSKHPQIGSREKVSAWSAAEQAGMDASSESTVEKLRELNRAYLERFGWIFIICATGRSAEEMRMDLERRLPHAPAVEIRIAAAEQAKIMQIRLRKLLRR